MPPFVRVLALLILLPGCTDSLGINLDCAVEQQRVRQLEGLPDETQRDEVNGDFVEQWLYFDSRRAYTFRWGPSHDGCQVIGPVRFQRDA